MIPIYRVVLRRLLAAWLLVSLVVGAGVYYVETQKLDDFVVALASSEAAQFSIEGLDPGRGKPQELAKLQQQALAFARQNFVVIDIYDQNRQKLVEAVNPKHASIIESLKPRLTPFPPEGRRHFYKRYDVLGETAVQVQVRLDARTGGTAGYFEGIFLVDQEVVASLRNNLFRTLAASLLAVLLTTVVLYPVIVALNRGVLRFSGEVLKGNLEIGAVLGAAIAKRDSETGEHNFRVTLYAIGLAESLGFSAHAMRGLILGAFLHDVGKIGIRDNILLKPGPLDDEEFAIMRTHVALGADIIEASEWLAPAREIIAYHHEKFDGSGYLQGLKGDDIPLAARLFTVVDVFDALTSHRPYKMPFPVEKALNMMAQEAGSHFDPHLVSRFSALAKTLHDKFGQASAAELQEKLHAEAVRYFFAATLQPTAAAGRPAV